MIDSLKEIDSGWIDFNKFKPSIEGYYDITACEDSENVIKWPCAHYSINSGKFSSIESFKSNGKEIKNVKFWRKIKHKCS